ncbi:hypothetical protein RRG08_063768 [Elysia crispata]|uniref:Uncharacterized protein n=1 Tax=Elysia crispata TaxID=231223 RepID=A0AAE1AJU1_9GAST|nr:hypothetical protein RRG08_063768 [Elysia crispata]
MLSESYPCCRYPPPPLPTFLPYATLRSYLVASYRIDPRSDEHFLGSRSHDNLIVSREKVKYLQLQTSGWIVHIRKIPPSVNKHAPRRSFILAYLYHMLLGGCKEIFLLHAGSIRLRERDQYLL